MATEEKKITLSVSKNLVFPFRISYRFAQDHPFLLGMVFFLYILYSYCPALFYFLVSSSPVLVCTTLLLGILLVHSEPNICETEEDKRRDISSLKGSVNVNDDGRPMVKMDKSNLEGHFDSSCKPVEKSDTSVADIIPMVHELHPLLDCEASQPAHKLIGNSEAGSSGSSQDIESDDDSAEEEAENQEDKEAREKDDTIEPVVTWTADDQKNLMDLGTSEIERNQRLENLIEKRRARKFLSFHVRENLIELDSNNHMPNTDDLYRFQSQIPSISAPRHNPFDLPFDTEETTGLPPIPCSAPSVLQPRRNPFEDGDSKPKPYLFPQRMHSEGIGLATSQRQSTEKSDSRTSPTHRSDTNSSLVDQENHEELLEEFHMESHVILDENHYAEPVDQGSQSSEEVDAENAIHLNSSSEGNHQAADALGAVEMEIRQGDFHSTDPRAENLEEIEERYDDSSSSSSGKNSKRFDDTQTVDHVYDSSTSAVEKSHSNMSTFDESLLFAGKKEVSLATVDESRAKEIPRTPQENMVTQQPDRGAIKDSDIGTSESASLIPKSRLKDFRVGSASSSGLSGLQLIAKVSRDKEVEGKVSNSSGKSTLGKVRNEVLVNLI